MTLDEIKQANHNEEDFPRNARPERKTKMIAITGNTYPVKDQLKALGARWNPDQKAWMVSEDKAEQARQIVAGAGPKKQYAPRQIAGASYTRANAAYARYGRKRDEDNECELCGKNKYTCGHCIGW